MAQATISRTQTENAVIDWQSVIRTGLIAGIVVVFVSAIGMLESFNEREVVRDWLTLGQVILLAPAIVGAYLYVNRGRDEYGKQAVSETNPVLTLVYGLLIGVVSSLPILALTFIATTIDVRDMFVNITRDLVEILTFDRDSALVGSLLLAGLITIMGLIGAAFSLIPDRVRHALQIGIGVTLGVGIMGELVVQILERFISDDILDVVFRRDSLKMGGALGLLVVSTGLALAWVYNGHIVRERYDELPNTQRRNVTFGGYGLLIVVLMALPWVLGTSLSQTMNLIGLYALMGLGLNIAIGLAGLLDLGYVTNFAVGAYVMGVLTSAGPLGVGNEFFNFWLVLPIAVLAAMLTGFLFALPVLKMRGDYLAIATLGFGEIIGTLARSDALRPIIGGPQGVTAIPNAQIGGLVFTGPELIYYLYLGAGALALFVSVRLNNSRIGRQWMSIREDEDVAAAMGINTARSKLLAFTLSAATGGLAGAIFAAQLRSVYPNSFEVLVSINVLSLIIIGGLGSIPGIVVGAVVLIGLPELLREFSDYRFLLYGALLVFMMISRPEGLIPSQVHRREMRREQEDSDIPASGVDKPPLTDAPSDDQATVE